MSLIFTEEDELLRESVLQFVQDEAMPRMAEQAARGGQYDCAMGLWPRMAELGFIGVSTSEEMGGLGLGVVQDLIVEEAIATAGCLATNIDAHNLALRAIEFQGSDYQKQTWGIPGAKGEIMFAASISDPAGSMNFPEWTISCVEDGDDVVINGTKNFCSNSQGADVYLIAVNDYDRGYPMTFVIVPADTPGLEMGAMEAVGMTGCNTGTIYLNDVRVPKENRMPAGDYGNAEWLALGYLDCSAALIGVVRQCIDIATNHIKTRSRNGRPIAKLQTAAHRIVDCELKYWQARSLMYTAAELWDAGTPDLKLHSLSKIACTEALTSVSQICVYLLGGYGVAPGTGVYEAYMLAPSGWVGECPNDFHRDLVAGLLGMPQDSWLNDPVK